MKKNKSIWGTSHFLSFNAAVKYFATQGDDEKEVKNKIAEGSIHIGWPETKKGQKAFLNQEEGRYFIEG